MNHCFLNFKMMFHFKVNFSCIKKKKKKSFEKGSIYFQIEHVLSDPVFCQVSFAAAAQKSQVSAELCEGSALAGLWKHREGRTQIDFRSSGSAAAQCSSWGQMDLNGFQ